MNGPKSDPELFDWASYVRSCVMMLVHGDTRMENHAAVEKVREIATDEGWLEYAQPHLSRYEGGTA